MQKLHHSIVINASKEKVWHTMLDDATYREWTVPFSPGSHYVGSWEEGSEIRFYDASGKSGMFSRIKENRKPEFVSIEHLGMIINGEVDTTSEEVKKWTPSFENYTLTEVDGGTEVSVDVDMNEEYADQCDALWPKALGLLKEIAVR